MRQPFGKRERRRQKKNESTVLSDLIRIDSMDVFFYTCAVFETVREKVLQSVMQCGYCAGNPPGISGQKEDPDTREVDV
jgi:hypothetical protein